MRDFVLWEPVEAELNYGEVHGRFRIVALLKQKRQDTVVHGFVVECPECVGAEFFVAPKCRRSGRPERIQTDQDISPVASAGIEFGDRDVVHREKDFLVTLGTAHNRVRFS
jgi:hypothetical protein